MSSSKQTHGRFCSRRATAAGTRGGCTSDCAPAATSRSSNAPTQRARRPSPLATAGSRCPPPLFSLPRPPPPPPRILFIVSTPRRPYLPPMMMSLQTTTSLRNRPNTAKFLQSNSHVKSRQRAGRNSVNVMAAGSSYGHMFRVTTFGESHGGGCGCIVDGASRILDVSTSRILDVSSFTHALTHASLNTPYTH